MNVQLMIRALELGGRAGGVSASELSARTGYSLYLCRKTLRELREANHMTRAAHFYVTTHFSRLYDTYSHMSERNVTLRG